VERRFAVHAGAAQQVAALVTLVVLATSPAHAAPKGGEARVQFDRGVAAYTKGDYAAAADALGASFVLEADPETLFAWAQTERKLGHCDRALELYAKLLAMDLPAENKRAIQVQIDECKAILAERPRTAPPPTTTAEPPVVSPATPAPAAVAAPTTEVSAPAAGSSETRAWWKDPVGGALVGTGAIGVGLGVVFLVQARAADADKVAASSYPEYQVLADRAEARGRLGVIGLVAGGALVAAGAVWYVTREPAAPAVTALVVPAGAGLAVSGRF